MTEARKPLPKGPFGEEFGPVCYCSFCLKSQDAVEKLIAGPGAIFICDQCVALCDVYVAGKVPDVDLPNYEDLPTERLIAQLPGIEATVRGKRTQLQWVVDKLRSREVSWAAIGEALGISRQSAWERFS
jgi:hypothetical protein